MAVHIGFCCNLRFPFGREVVSVLFRDPRSTACFANHLPASLLFFFPDERTAQTSYVIDKFLRQNTVTARNHLSVQSFAAIPVAQRLRMTPDPESRLALDDVLRRSYDTEKNEGKPVATFFLEEITRRLKDAVSPDASEDEKSKAEKEVRLDVYREICDSKVDKRMLLRYLQRVFESPEAFFLFRRALSVHLAVNSLQQYVFSVAERTPQRFVMLQSNGRVMSPDFRVSYSNQGFIEAHQIPFRMTPNIETLLGEHHMQGIFIRSMAMVAGAIREHKEEFDPILRLLMRDDILAWYSKSLAKSDSKTQELERQLIERVSKNVYTLQARFFECAPSTKTGGDLMAPPIDKRVGELVKTATDAEKLCMMPASYHAWL
jgi:transformation/transcription domain-associated protein